MTELEAIAARHSVRAYEDKPIAEETLALLRGCIEECNRAGNLHLQLVEDAGGTFNRLLNKFMGLGSAPSVIACIGVDDGTLEERIGYYGEKLVLYAQSLGLNTCWAGTFQKKNVQAECRPGERLVIVIAIGYGAVSGKPHKSKKPEQVVRDGVEQKPQWFLDGVAAALLAPTAVNQQRFELVLKEDDTVEVVDLGGILSKVDKGIVKYHFEVGAGR